jgi:hypothetical protein
MRKGRVTKEEQKRRIKLLLRFIFTFKYAARNQADMFIQEIINMTYTRRLIAYCLKESYLKSCRERWSRVKVYYLTKKATDFIYEEECFSEDYRFEKSCLGVNTFNLHNIAVEVYFKLKKLLIIKEWFCAWVLRIGEHKRAFIPDSVIALQSGAVIALEIETQVKKLSELKHMVDIYRYDIDQKPKYDAVLMVIEYKLDYEGIKKRLFHLAPEFCSRAFILADLDMLNQGSCFYQKEIRSLEEAFKLLAEKGKNGQKI